MPGKNSQIGRSRVFSAQQAEVVTMLTGDNGCKRRMDLTEARDASLMYDIYKSRLVK